MGEVIMSMFKQLLKETLEELEDRPREAGEPCRPPFLPTPTMADLFAIGVKPSATQRNTNIISQLIPKIAADEFGSVLDYGAGKCLSKEVLNTYCKSKNIKLKLDTYEIDPPAGIKPTYTTFNQIKKKYQLILNTYVLNVCALDIRELIVSQIGDLLDVGGRAIIVTRGTDVADAKTYLNYKYAPYEHVTKGAGGLTYQKGFTQDELIEFCSSVLGGGFDILPLSGGNKTSVRIQIIKT